MKNIKLGKRISYILGAGITSFVLVTTGCSSKENEVSDEPIVTYEDNTNETEEISNFDNFESEKNEINELIYKDNFELANEVWSSYFIDAVDMIFYDKEYKDTKWSELNLEAQQEVIDNLNSIDNTFRQVYPEYHEDWEKTKGIATNLYFEGLNKIKEVIGEDNYNDIKDIKDNIKEQANNIYNRLKDKTCEWYQDYKGNNMQ